MLSSVPIKVLLVDDDEDDFIITRDTLDEIKVIQYDVTWVATASDCLDKIKEFSYDIILLDYYLGKQTGLELLEQIREHDEQTPIIILTGLSDIRVDLEAMHAGAVDFHVKNDLTGPCLERTIRYTVERQRINNQLSQLVKRHTTIMNAVPVAIYLKDNEQKYIEVNDSFCDFVGKSRSEIVGKTIHEFCDQCLADQIDKLDREALSSDQPLKDIETKLDIGCENSKRVSIVHIPLVGTGNQKESLVGLIQDITDVYNNRKQLIQSEKLAAIGQLSAGVAHEINNPVGYIKSNLSIMKKYLNKINERIEKQLPGFIESESDMFEDFQDAIDESISGTTRIINIVSDLKGFSRTDKAEEAYSDINQGIVSTLNIVNNELKYKCEVRKELGDIPNIYCRLNHINQIFLILLINAGQAITSDGIITIKSWEDQNNVFVSIEDNGSGIPEGSMNRIFEPFYTTKEVGEGTGLGLSLAYDIITKHNGKIDVTSEVGVGTKFTISIPRIIQEQSKEDMTPELNSSSCQRF
ncbi:MAG: response regulator [candidate division Zixibacteria bacterium]|nr:response regulator [candidate division Zixibacteria bacterium]